MLSTSGAQLQGIPGESGSKENLNSAERKKKLVKIPFCADKKKEGANKNVETELVVLFEKLQSNVVNGWRVET